MKATTRDACRLMREGSIALSRVERNGIRIDVERLDRTIVRVRERIDELSERLMATEEWRTWRKTCGARASLGSRQQLAKVLKRLGHELGGRTRSGRRESTSQESLERLNSPFVRGFLRLEKLKKLHGTYLLGVRREVHEDGFLRPFFNLHTVKTYRGSSNRPNFQNVPIREEWLAKLIRPCFVPRPGHVLVEVDFKQLEVSIAACYHRDPKMIEHLRTGHDFHLDWACRLYMLEREEVSGETRFCAKNSFVFPEFYGSYFMKCATNLWLAIDQMSLTVKGTDVSLKDRLRDGGVEKLGGTRSKWNRDGDGRTGWIDTEKGTFVDHVRNCEEDLWKEYAVYARWKRDWHKAYLRRGWFEMLTGFRETGVYERNDVISHPVQGTAFHCLLWCLIELVKWIGRERRRTKIVGQIHDSVLADVPEDELEEYVAKVRELMTRRIGERWSWIVVPLAVDVSVSRRNWFEKERLAT